MKISQAYKLSPRKSQKWICKNRGACIARQLRKGFRRKVN